MYLLNRVVLYCTLTIDLFTDSDPGYLHASINHLVISRVFYKLQTGLQTVKVQVDNGFVIEQSKDINEVTTLTEFHLFTEGLYITTEVLNITSDDYI